MLTKLVFWRMQEPEAMCERDDNWSSILTHGLLCISLHNEDCKLNYAVMNIGIAIYVILVNCRFRFRRLFITVSFVSTCTRI
jgi:hypothetical protein